VKRLFRGVRVLTGLTPLVVAFLRDRRRLIVLGRPARRTAQHHEKRAERLVARVAGLGIRYDRNFDGLGVLKKVIRGLKGEIVKTAAREPVAVARDLLGEAQTALRTMMDLLTRAEREELRVRVHPRDIQGQERFFHLQARRVTLSIFATATAVISLILYISVRSVWLLAVGFALALLMLVLVFFIPTHLLENPLRHARRIRPGERNR
jgi:hypothetical protein